MPLILLHVLCTKNAAYPSHLAMSAECLVWYEHSALTARGEETVHSALRARAEDYGLYLFQFFVYGRARRERVECPYTVYHSSRALNEECRVSFTTCYRAQNVSYDTSVLRSQHIWRKRRCILLLEHVEKDSGLYPSPLVSFSTWSKRRMSYFFLHLLGAQNASYLFP
jgi:hypothetical protein